MDFVNSLTIVQIFTIAPLWVRIASILITIPVAIIIIRKCKIINDAYEKTHSARINQHLNTIVE